MDERHNRHGGEHGSGYHGAGQGGHPRPVHGLRQGHGAPRHRVDGNGGQATGQPGEGPGHGSGRGAPPEATGAETNYIVKNMQAKTPMVVRLMDNQEVRGWIEYYDRQVIKLNRQQPPHLFIRKDQIKYMYKDEEAAKSPSRDEP